jgi:hypothetical protein
MTASPADAIQLAADTLSPEAQVAWHCRRWSGWCHRRYYYRRYYWPRRDYYRRHYWRHRHWRRW